MGVGLLKWGLGYVGRWIAGCGSELMEEGSLDDSGGGDGSGGSETCSGGAWWWGWVGRKDGEISPLSGGNG